MSEPIPQRSAAQVAAMAPEDVKRAVEAGELEALLRGDDPGKDAAPLEKPEQVTGEQLKAMTPEEVAQADREGRLVELLGGQV